MIFNSLCHSYPSQIKKNHREHLALKLIIKCTTQMLSLRFFSGRVAVTQGKQCCLDVPLNSQQYQDNGKGTTSCFMYV